MVEAGSSAGSNVETEVQSSSYAVLILLGMSRAVTDGALLNLSHCILIDAGLLFGAGILYLASLPVRALWKLVPEREAKLRKRSPSASDGTSR